jgi:hypothetical protein
MDELGARDRTTSRTVQLAFEDGQPLDLVAPAGSTVAGLRPGLIVFGPLTCSVVASLWNVGLPNGMQPPRYISDRVPAA